MRFEETLALTPTLSPRRGGGTHRAREFSRPLVWRCFCLATVLLIDTASAQNLLPNPGFEEGREAPTGWRQVGASGRRIENAHNARNALMVRGGGNDASYWQAEVAALQPGGLYRLSFFARRDHAASDTGVVTSGLSRVNRDFPASASWQRYKLIFSVPLDDTNDFVRIGQWHLKGNVSFGEPELFPVIAIHKRIAGGAELGEGESIEGGVYRFRPVLTSPAGNYHRPLFANRASFNSDRWVFSSGAEIIYRLGLGGCTQVEGKVEAYIKYHAGGTLHVDASRDGTNWVSVAAFDKQRPGGWSDLPGRLFPADELFIRLSCQGTNGHIQVNSFEFESRLAKSPPDTEGATYFLEVQRASPEVAVSLQNVQRPIEDGLWLLEWATTNRTKAPLNLQAALGLESAPLTQFQKQKVAPLARAEWKLSCAEGDSGDYDLSVRFQDNRGRALFAGRVPVSSSFLSDRRPGYLLRGSRDIRAWWCESGWKIGLERPPPEQPDGKPFEPVRVAAARGEYEPVQIVLNPLKDCQLTAAKIGAFQNAQGEAGGISGRIDEVAYVLVTRGTDSSCLPGPYPDPLPPLRTPLDLRRERNQPLWVTFHVAPGSKAGDFNGELSLKTSLGPVSVPVTIHVYDFTLPDQAHLKSAIDLSVANINRYHHLKTAQDKVAVYEKYLLNFAQHHLSPQVFSDYAPIDVRFVGEGTNLQAKIDFNRFDQAAKRWLDDFHFNTFRLPVLGMGSGDYQHRVPGKLAGFKEGTSEHARLLHEYLSQVEQHLGERGWLDKAYTYWFDEPGPKDFDFVAEGMKRLKTAAPGLRRMVTKVPQASLVGNVDIWCGVTPQWTPSSLRERQAAGEETWWYLCTSSKSPYITEFIDHPGTELRLWPWQSWQYGVSGILLWNSVYWNSPAVFPEPQCQNPWTDPMSYWSHAGVAAGYVGVWGNGDGRFLYPPAKDAETNSSPCLDGPVNSVRWENLRDGMEDYEYFWLLKQAVERAEAAGVPAGVLHEARQLLVVPPEVSMDLTHFTTDPRLLLAHRDRVARMIEQLQHARNP